jgi:hypothetical protein
MQQWIGDRFSKRLVDAYVAASDFKLNLFPEPARRRAPAARGCPCEYFTRRHQAQLDQPFFKFDKPPPQLPGGIVKSRFVSRRG